MLEAHTPDSFLEFSLGRKSQSDARADSDAEQWGKQQNYGFVSMPSNTQGIRLFLYEANFPKL